MNECKINEGWMGMPHGCVIKNEINIGDEIGATTNQQLLL